MISNDKHAHQKERLAEFISRSSAFWDDANISEIDAKHRLVIGNAEAVLSQIGAVAERNWSMQSDLEFVSQFSVAHGVRDGLIRPLYRKIFRRAQERATLSTILDDIEIIKQVGAWSILEENPYTQTPGAGGYSVHNNQPVNLRWLRYIYLAHRILDQEMISERGVWVDVGSYYGGLQGIIHKYRPNSVQILVDFHHQLARSYSYLSELFPSAKHVFPDEIEKSNLALSSSGCFVYCPVQLYKNLRLADVDLFSNFFSFGEMRRPMFEAYLNSQPVSVAKRLYMVNRFVSAPFFEPTYDSDLNVFDYCLKKNRRYFDVFPMHHFQAVERNVLNRMAPRNISSSYFEVLFTNA